MATSNAWRIILHSRFKKQAGNGGLERNSAEVKIANGKGGWSPDFSSVARVRRRRTSANDFARAGAVSARSKIARQKRRAHRGRIHFFEQALFSRKNCLRHGVCATSAWNSSCACHYGNTRPDRFANTISSR